MNQQLLLSIRGTLRRNCWLLFVKTTLRLALPPALLVWTLKTTVLLWEGYTGCNGKADTLVNQQKAFVQAHRSKDPHFIVFTL